MDRGYGVNEMKEFRIPKTLAPQGIEPNGGGALSSNVSKLGSKEVIRHAELADCELRAELDGKMAKPLQTSIADPLNASNQAVSASHNETVFSRFTSHFSRKRVAFTLAEGATHVDTYGGKRKIAFTLAEVLITLGIIGVVASLTLPSVITKYQKQQTIAQLKKAYSTLDNASRLSQVENGEMRTWDKELYHTNIKKYVETYYLPYINGEMSVNWVNKKYTIYNLNGIPRYTYAGFANNYDVMLKTADGQLFIFHSTSEGQSYLWIFADINGTKGPNRIGRDIFVFDGRDYGSNDKYLVHFWGQFWGRNELMNDNVTENVHNSRGYGCSKKNKYGYYAGFYCGALIIQDGWKISDDYPW